LILEVAWFAAAVLGVWAIVGVREK
jgi:hypothetical protein